MKKSWLLVGLFLSVILFVGVVSAVCCGDGSCCDDYTSQPVARTECINGVQNFSMTYYSAGCTTPGESHPASEPSHCWHGETPIRYTQPCGPSGLFGNSLDNGLISYWPFDTATGSNSTLAKDVVGDNDGAVNGPTQTTSDVKGEDYSFDGVNDYIRISSINLKQNHTLSAWVKPLISYSNGVILGSGAPNSYGLYLSHSGLPGICYQPSTKVSQPDSCIFYNVPPNLWSQIVISRVQGNISVYVNGIRVASTIVNVVTWPDEDLFLEFMGLEFLTAFPFPGNIDEVGIWNRALNDSEVQQLYGYYSIRPAPYWSNLNGVEINNANLGDSVLTLVSGGVSLNQEITSRVYRVGNSDFVWWKFWTWFSFGVNLVTSGNTPLWVANNGTGIFFFNATVSSGEYSSENLDIAGTTNSAPMASILSPTFESKLQAGVAINFSHNSSDEDDLLKVIWEFGDGEEAEFEDYSLALTPGLGNTQHTYNQSGVYYVTLTVEEMTRNGKNSKTIPVFAYQEGINVMPYITKPARGSSYGNFVDFDASESHVADCAISCASGKTCFDAGSLRCYYLHAKGALTTPGYTLTANWTFITGSKTQVRNGDWAANYQGLNGVVKFTQFFLNPGWHVAKLRLNYKI